jgi:hypothetical protein
MNNDVDIRLWYSLEDLDYQDMREAIRRLNDVGREVLIDFAMANNKQDTPLFRMLKWRDE